MKHRHAHVARKPMCKAVEKVLSKYGGLTYMEYYYKPYYLTSLSFN